MFLPVKKSFNINIFVFHNNKQFSKAYALCFLLSFDI